MSSNNTDNILKQANDIVNNRSEEKERKYGPFDESMIKTAQLASLMSNKTITTIDCFHVLIALKLSRESHCHQRDNLLDAAAYIGAMDNFHDKFGPAAYDDPTTYS